MASTQGARTHLFKKGGPGPGAKAIWRGLIAFGAVHIPVTLHSGVEDKFKEGKFVMIDRRSLEPIGNAAVNRNTREEVPRAEIGKGVEYDGRYVLIDKEQMHEGLPKTTQVVETESFVNLRDIPPAFFAKTFIIRPQQKAEHAYALLREALLRADKVAIGRVVLSTRQYLAAIAPEGNGLVLHQLRWVTEVREVEVAGISKAGPAANGVRDAELALATELVAQKTQAWMPEAFADELGPKIDALVAAKVSAKDGKAKPIAGEVVPMSSVGADLEDLLKRSVTHKATPAVKKAKAPTAKKAEAPAAKKPAAAKRHAPAKKPAAAKKAPASRKTGAVAKKVLAKPPAKTGAKKAATKKATPPKSRVAAAVRRTKPPSPPPAARAAKTPSHVSAKTRAIIGAKMRKSHRRAG